jgi:hypothetical protein
VLCGAWCGGAARGGGFFVGFLLSISIINCARRDTIINCADMTQKPRKCEYFRIEK